MAHINPYLHLNGTAREAFEFYKSCFGGELMMQSIGESPMKDKMPGGAESNKKIMHASLTVNGQPILMGADMMDPKTFTPGDTFSVSINCESEEEINALFSKLSKGGKVTSPLKTEFWGGTFGTLTDKFGVDWMLNFQKPKA